MKLYTISLISAILIFVIWCNYNKEKSVASVQDVPIVSFPFKNLFDENGNPINIILISAPFRTPEHEKLYREYKEMGMYFCGISSYSQFPDKLTNPFEDRYHERERHDYIRMVSAWLHCFKNIPLVLQNASIPRILLTEADLKDTITFKPDPRIVKTRDFIYSCAQDNPQCSPGWQSEIRNWELAKKCLHVMCEHFNLKGLLVGRINCEYTDKCKHKMDTVPFLPFSEFQREMQASRFLFVPNILDASPRVITEALTYNIPVLVNRNIVGGWHNVIPGITGEFFTDEHDIRDALYKILYNYESYTPRDWFIKNRGRDISGVELASFLKSNYPGINNPDLKYATITL